MRFFSGQFLSGLRTRIAAWKQRRRASQSLATSSLIDLATYSPAIHRDVTSNGVRFYSLCGCCGAQLNASATLCGECAQKKRPARPI
jgi:predicted amidophosphoribosyltransferase